MTRTILITGANRGLGLNIAHTFLKQGDRVFAINRSESKESAQLLADFPETYTIAHADTTQVDEIAEAVKTIRTHTDHIDTLINNAAVHLEQPPLPLQEVDFSIYAKSFEVNATSPLMVIQQLESLLLKGTDPALINITSEAGSIADCHRDQEFAYCMSKSAANMLTKMMHNYLNPQGVSVVAMHPGWFSSDMGGTEAPITPAEAAVDIVNTITTQLPIKDSIYIDRFGSHMNW